MSISKPLPELDQSDLDRVIAGTNKEAGQGPKGDCWEWDGTLDARNYATIGIYNKEWTPRRKTIRVCRIAYMMHHGKDAHPLVVRHSCNNPPCVRGEHLVAGTQQQNVADAIRDGIFRASVKPKVKRPPNNYEPTTTALPISLLTASYVAAFNAKIDRTPGHGPKGDCHIWTKSIRGKYGYVRIKNKPYTASRIAYYLNYGVDPGTNLVLHSCDFKNCCNPVHLSLGGHNKNAADRVERGQQASLGRHGRAKITREIALEAKRLHDELGYSDRKIAAFFGVDPMTINLARRGKTGWLKSG